MFTDGWTRRDFFRRAAAAGAVAIGGPTLLSACGGTEDKDTLAIGREQGYLRVGVANEPPYTQITANGELTGVEPDVLRAVLKRLGIPEIQGLTTPYNQMIPGLKADRWDVVAAGLFMKQSRCAEVLYSEPDIVSTESFAVPAGNPKNITTVAFVLENPVKIAVLGGAFEEGILKDAGVSDDKLVTAPDARGGLEAVKAGRADAFFLPTLSLKELVVEDAAIDVTPPVEDAPKTGAGAAFRKTDENLHAEYNKELAALKATPEFAEILSKWGFDAKDVEGVTTEELCQTPG